MSRTGSGKTAAFLLPVFERLMRRKVGPDAGEAPRALVLSPTRELALQTLKFTKQLGRFTKLKCAVILGGERMDDQFSVLHQKPDILIATPGRLLHLLVEMQRRLGGVEYVVFDEADRLFEMGFSEQLREILARLPAVGRQTLIFSATLPKLVVEFARAGLHDPILVRLDVDAKLSEQLETQFFFCRLEDKTALLLKLLSDVLRVSRDRQAILFAATKHHVEYLQAVLSASGYDAVCAFSSLDPVARKVAVSRFRAKQAHILIVTDLAARGIDIPLLSFAINFNLPAKAKLFVHRVGRVARAGMSGSAFSLVSPDELAFLIDLHLFLGKPLKLSSATRTTTAGSAQDGTIGTVSDSRLESEISRLHSLHEREGEIKAMLKVCSNAYKQYSKSRPCASAESIKRAKELLTDPPSTLGKHPQFCEREEVGREKLLDQMRTYKPKSTVFEMGRRAESESARVMKSKRQIHSDVIERTRAAREIKREATSIEAVNDKIAHLDEHDDTSGFSNIIDARAAQKLISKTSLSFRKREKKERRVAETPLGRDAEHFVHYRPKDFHQERGYGIDQGGSLCPSLGCDYGSFERDLSVAQMDLAGDDHALATQQKKQEKHWDRKRKRYVGDSGDGKNKKIKTESGNLISASYKSDKYEKWLSRRQSIMGGDGGDIGVVRRDGRRFKHTKGVQGGKRTHPEAYGAALKKQPSKRTNNDSDKHSKLSRRRAKLLKPQKSMKVDSGLKTKGEVLKGRKDMVKNKLRHQGKGRQGGSKRRK